MGTTHKQRFLKQAFEWIGARESGGQNKYQKGTKLAAIFQTAGAAAGTAWCAVFVYACAKRAGATSLIGAGTKSKDWFTAPGVCHSVVNKGGTWIPGPNRTKGKVVPRPGDLILYKGEKAMKYNAAGKVTSWHGSHIGIVYSVTKKKIISIEGNMGGGKCGKRTNSFTNKQILGYARPKWSKIDKGNGNGGEVEPELYDGPLYEVENTRHDMTLREIGYMTTGGKLTTANTGIKISLINYTSLMGDIYDMFERQTYRERQVNTKKLKGNEKEVVETLLDLGLSASAACGIAGNIKVDSNYNPAKVGSDGGVGLALWRGTHATQMKDYAGITSWATNLSGQVEYIYNDIANDYSELYLAISSNSISKEETEKVAKLYANNYRKIKDTKSRVSAAQTIYSKLVVTAPKQVGTTPSPSENTANKVTVIDTSKKKQSGLGVCYLDYTRTKYDSSIYDEWVKAGKPTDRGIAYINGSYLIVLDASLACKVNDYVDLDLSSGSTLPCIVVGRVLSLGTLMKFCHPAGTTLNLTPWASQKITKIRDHGGRKT